MAVDPVLVTGATAVATGALGYLGALLQHGSERDRLGLERKRLEGETARLHADRLEEQRARRQALYLKFLGSAEEAWTLSSRRDPVHESDLDAWWRAYQGVRRTLQIGAASPVVAQAMELNTLLVNIFSELVSAVDHEDPEAARLARQAVWADHGQSFDGELQQLQQLMRTDLEVAE